MNTSFSIYSSVVLLKLLSISQSMFPNILVPRRSLLPLREVWERVGVIAHGRVQAPVVQKVDNAIHQINLYPLDSVSGFLNIYPLDSDLSGA